MIVRNHSLRNMDMNENAHVLSLLTERGFDLGAESSHSKRIIRGITGSE